MHKRELTINELQDLPDEKIDLSEIPEANDDFWKLAQPRIPKTMEMIQVIVDRDIAEFFKESGKKINDVLRDYVDVHHLDHDL